MASIAIDPALRLSERVGGAENRGHLPRQNAAPRHGGAFPSLATVVCIAVVRPFAGTIDTVWYAGKLSLVRRARDLRSGSRMSRSLHCTK